jgi:hypothetical protein
MTPPDQQVVTGPLAPVTDPKPKIVLDVFGRKGSIPRKKTFGIA